MGKARIIVIGGGERIRRYISFALKFPISSKSSASRLPPRRETIPQQGNIPFPAITALPHGRRFSRPVFADGAVVASSPGHSPWTHALERGYHLMIENPEELTAGDCDSIIALKGERGFPSARVILCGTTPSTSQQNRFSTTDGSERFVPVSLGRTAAGSGKNPACASSRCRYRPSRLAHGSAPL